MLSYHHPPVIKNLKKVEQRVNFRESVHCYKAAGTTTTTDQAKWTILK